MSSDEAECLVAPPGSVGSSGALRVLPFALSVIAGSADIISFLGLGGLFTAHITGNLAILAAHVVNGEPAPVALLLSVPVFMVAVALTRSFVACLDSIAHPSLLPLLVLQLLLLAGFLVLAVAAGPHIDRDVPIAVAAGMLGVSAMAVQNALVQVALPDAPPTAVMTTNVTRFTMDVVQLLLGRDVGQIRESRQRAKRTWPSLVGFLIGCGLGAACEPAVGLWSLALPTALALLCIAMACSTAGRGDKSGKSADLSLA